MLLMKSRKRDSAKGIELPNQECIRTFGEKVNYKYLGISEVDTTKQSEMKEKILERVPQKNEKVSQNQTLQQKSHQRDKPLGSPSGKIFRIILKIDKEGTQKNGQEN